MASNKLYTTVEIELVQKLFNDFRKGKELRVTEEEHSFLRNAIEPRMISVNYGDDANIVTYRGWAVVYNSSYFNKHGREGIMRADNPDYDLESLLHDAHKYQAGDIVRTIVYDGKPIQILVQTAMIEIAFKLGFLPRRTSDQPAMSRLITIAEELQENGTFNI